MTEQELVQEVLANLPRPTPPPRLRRAIMAQVVTDARAEAPISQVRTWSRTDADGWTKEQWEGIDWATDMILVPTPAHVSYTHWRQDEPGRTTIYQFTQTY